MPNAFDAAAGMAVWDEELWREFEATLTGPRRKRTARQRPAEETHYAGARPIFWISLAVIGLAWLL
jgi:hypothetical protein